MRTLTAWLGLALSYVLYHAPPGFRRGLGNALAFVWFDLFRIRRGVVLDNIKIAYPEMNLQERTQLGRTSLRGLGLNFIEYSFLPWLNVGNRDRFFRYEGLDLLDEVLSRGKGAILITLHLGHGDLACVGLALTGRKITMVSKFFKWRWLNDLWFGMREKHGMRFIAPRDSSYALLRALKNGEAVIMPLDQFMGPPIGVKSRFFGRETGTAAGPIVMAARSGAPVITVYTHRAADGCHVLRFDREIEIDSTRSQVATERNVQILNDQLEKYVRLHPEQWMWIHRRWKTFEVR